MAVIKKPAPTRPRPASIPLKPTPHLWLDRLIKAELLMERRSMEYEATLGDPDALIVSPAWEAFSRAAQRRDAIRDKYWKDLLQLAASAVQR